jgi:hypothetical protein
MHIYAFGSICRGEIDYGSDIDLLAIVDDHDGLFDPNVFSIYSYQRIKELWEEGNPFAWHLAKEARLLYSLNGDNFIKKLNTPNKYNRTKTDCEKFQRLFFGALSSIESGSNSPVYDLSTIFLAIRNFAICYALGCLDLCEFSRYSPQRLGDKSLEISDEAYGILERSRILSTRGYGKIIEKEEVQKVLKEVTVIHNWMKKLLNEV